MPNHLGTDTRGVRVLTVGLTDCVSSFIPRASIGILRSIHTRSSEYGESGFMVAAVAIVMIYFVCIWFDRDFLRKVYCYRSASVIWMMSWDALFRRFFFLCLFNISLFVSPSGNLCILCFWFNSIWFDLIWFHPFCPFDLIWSNQIKSNQVCGGARFPRPSKCGEFSESRLRTSWLSERVARAAQGSSVRARFVLCLCLCLCLLVSVCGEK